MNEQAFKYMVNDLKSQKGYWHALGNGSLIFGANLWSLQKDLEDSASKWR